MTTLLISLGVILLLGIWVMTLYNRIERMLSLILMFN